MSSTAKFFLLFFCLMVSSSVFGVESGNDEEENVKNELQRLIDNYKVRTAVVMSIEDDSTEIGIVNLGEISDSRRELPDENSTIFEIGSLASTIKCTLGIEGMLFS